jgi:hypothetical protein
MRGQKAEDSLCPLHWRGYGAIGCVVSEWRRVWARCGEKKGRGRNFWSSDGWAPGPALAQEGHNARLDLLARGHEGRRRRASVTLRQSISPRMLQDEHWTVRQSSTMHSPRILLADVPAHSQQRVDGREASRVEASWLPTARAKRRGGGCY